MSTGNWQQPSNPATRPSRRAFFVSTGRAALGAAALGSAGLSAQRAAAEERDKDLPDNPLNSDKKIRIGVVGGGMGAAFSWHLHPNCTVQAVSDLIPDRRASLQNKYQCELAYDSLEELIKDKNIDAVAVFTGAPDHFKHTKLCMDAGKHVICAVPVVMTLDEAHALKEIKERTGLTYMLAETSCYYPGSMTTREYFKEGLFGTLYRTECEYAHPIGNENPDGIQTRNAYWFHDGKPTWRHGYPPMLYPGHGTGFVNYVTGDRFTEVSAMGWRHPDDPILSKGENQYGNQASVAIALMRSSSGGLCRNVVDYAGCVAGEWCDFYGSMLTVLLPSPGKGFSCHGPNADKTRGLLDFSHKLPKALRSAEGGHAGAERFITHEFIAALVEEREPEVDLYEALAQTVCGIVANESCKRDGELMKIPDFGRSPKRA